MFAFAKVKKGVCVFLLCDTVILVLPVEQQQQQLVLECCYTFMLIDFSMDQRAKISQITYDPFASNYNDSLIRVGLGLRDVEQES